MNNLEIGANYKNPIDIPEPNIRFFTMGFPLTLKFSTYYTWIDDIIIALQKLRLPTPTEEQAPDRGNS